jgi:DNA recombination protein RmuC
MEIIYLILGLLIGAGGAFFIAKFKYQSRSAKMEAEHSHLQQHIKEQRGELDEIQRRFTAEFENLANRIFDEKSRQNKSNLGEILQPLGERIKEFERKVNEVYLSETRERSSLSEQLRYLLELNQQMSKEANNLTRALKGDSKTQGSWGEVILESILEKSGLEKGREFIVQESFRDEDGSKMRPDVIVKLPEGKNIIIDSKVSLTAYEAFCSEEDESLRKKCLADHISSVRGNVKNLSSKNYQNLYGLQSLDFVLMFIPVEPAFGLAAQNERNLFDEAFAKNIVIVSPSTLLAALKTIAGIWKQEKQNHNAMEIARQSGELYDKFAAFIEDLKEVGNKLNKTQSSYEDAMKKLHIGRGSIIGQIEKIKKLGADSTRTLPQDLIDSASYSEEIKLINPRNEPGAAS